MTLSWATEHDINRRFGPQSSNQINQPVRNGAPAYTQAPPQRIPAEADRTLSWATDHDIERRFGRRQWGESAEMRYDRTG